MKKCLKKVTSYIMVLSISLNCSSYVFANKEKSSSSTGFIGSTTAMTSSRYTDNGFPIVRRQVFLEDEKNTYSSLRRTIKPRIVSDVWNTQKKMLPPRMDINNLVIFLRFKGEPEFITDEKRSLFEEHYNGEGISVKSYLRDVSYGQFHVNSDFFPCREEDGKFYSCEVENRRSYYQPFSESNPNGYRETRDSEVREFKLLSEAFSYCRPMIEKKYSDPGVLDFDGDGKVDNVVFVVSGKEDTWEDTLWPHQYVIPQLYSPKIYDRRVKLYNFMLEKCFQKGNIGTSVHEFLHTKGFPDFYRYKSKGTPVGHWDLMSMQYNIPQFPLVYPRYKYGGFCNKPVRLSEGGRYTIYPSTTKDYQKDIAYILQSPTEEDSDEYFIVEYRSPDKSSKEVENCETVKVTKNSSAPEDSRQLPLVEKSEILDISEGISLKCEQNPCNASEEQYCWDRSLPGEGLLIYRFNKHIPRGNASSDGKIVPDQLFVYRKGVSSHWMADGNIEEGALLKTGDSLGYISPVKQKSWGRYNGPKLENMIYCSDGTNSGIRIYDISIDQQNKVAHFRVEFDGTQINKFEIGNRGNVQIDNKEKQILITLRKGFKDRFIVPKVVHTGRSINPEEGIPIVISDDMSYKITSSTGMTQVWKIITSPLGDTNKRVVKVNDETPVVVEANLYNKEGVTYKWYYDGELIDDVSEGRLTLEDPKDNKRHEVYAVASNVAGELKCAMATIEWNKDLEDGLEQYSPREWFSRMMRLQSGMLKTNFSVGMRIGISSDSLPELFTNSGSRQSRNNCRYVAELLSSEEFKQDEVIDEDTSEVTPVEDADVNPIKDIDDIKLIEDANVNPIKDTDDIKLIEDVEKLEEAEIIEENDDVQDDVSANEAVDAEKLEEQVIEPDVIEVEEIKSQGSEVFIDNKLPSDEELEQDKSTDKDIVDIESAEIAKGDDIKDDNVYVNVDVDEEVDNEELKEQVIEPETEYSEI